MVSFFRRWRWRHLFSAWLAYWAGLVVVVLWEPLTVARRLARLPDNQASIAVEFKNTVFSAVFAERGVTVWSGTATLLEIVLWIAGPPLLLWVIWAMSRPKARSAAYDTSLGSAADAPQLREGIDLEEALASRQHTVREDSPRVRR